MPTHTLLLLPGDGIGVETVAEVERLHAQHGQDSGTGAGSGEAA